MTSTSTAQLVSISNLCRNGRTHDFGSFVDDLLIDIRLETFDGFGGACAFARTCAIHTNGGLPWASEIVFDTADFNRWGSRLRIAALHEMGHALAQVYRLEGYLLKRE